MKLIQVADKIRKNICLPVSLIFLGFFGLESFGDHVSGSGISLAPFLMGLRQPVHFAISVLHLPQFEQTATENKKKKLLYTAMAKIY